MTDRSRSEEGVPIVQIGAREGTELVLTTHNFCDPTTWYTTSARVVEETLSDSGDGLTFTSANTNWIDMTHGKLWDEDALCLDVGHGYSVDVTSDAVAQTQRTPFAANGGDFTVDYAAGTVTFASSQAGKAVVATYSRMVDSLFSIVPDSGTILDIESAIVKFTQDVVMNDAVVFEIWAYNPFNLPNKVAVKTTSYKTISNFLEEASEATAQTPALGGGVRGAAGAMVRVTFRYGTARSLVSSAGVELRCRLESDIPFTGDRAVGSFFITVLAE